MSTFPRYEAPRIKLVPFDEIQLDSKPRYLVHGLIPRVGLTVIYGPPKSGKSYWTLDLLMHVALGWNYRRRRVQQGPVIYAAFEGQFGFRARCEAFRQRRLSEQAGNVPLYLVPVQLDLVKDASDFVHAIRDALREVSPAAIVLDTLNRSLRGSESSDQDMSAYVRAADRIREEFECAVLVVHHSGVDASRPRGHTSLTGAADAQLAVKRDGAGNVIVTVEWMKDGPEGETIVSVLESFEVGQDAEGEVITSCIVKPADAVPSAHARGPRLTANQQSMLNILDNAGRNGLTTEEWNEKARENGIGISRRATLMDLRKALKDKNLVHVYSDRWHLTR
jgi:KaiC/GvpD/RAD55 family RecA-like ATPase